MGAPAGFLSKFGGYRGFLNLLRDRRDEHGNQTRHRCDGHIIGRAKPM
jgi:hypothetical protein